MPAALFAKSMKNGRHSERPPTSVDAVAQTITSVFFSLRAQSSVTTSAWLYSSLSRSTPYELVSRPLSNFHTDESHRYDHLQKLDFSRPKLESASAPSRGWNAWNSVRGRAGAEAVISEFILLRLRSDRPRPVGRVAMSRANNSRSVVKTHERGKLPKSG